MPLLIDGVAHHQLHSSRPHRFCRNPFRRRRTHHIPLNGDAAHDMANQPKPIYIYPGLLRSVRDKAIALDNQCPAILYKCRDCPRDISRHLSPDTPSDNLADASKPASRLERAPYCSHQHACSICLDEFHGKDLVRKLPCNVNHVFHSKCILDWFISHHRCPLCNEPVTNTAPARPSARRDDHRVIPPEIHPLPVDAPHHDLHRGRSYRTISNLTMDGSREAQVPSQERRLSDSAAPPISEHTSELGPLSTRDDSCQEEVERSAKPPLLTQTEKTKKRSRGPRTYSYIVHDNVRMEMNPVIPV